MRFPIRAGVPCCALLVACFGSSDAPTAQLDLVLGADPREAFGFATLLPDFGFDAFEVEVLGLQLVRRFGPSSGPLLTAGFSIDCAGLQRRPGLVFSGAVPAGTYDGVEVRLGPELRALDRRGELSTPTPVGFEFTARLAEPLVLEPGGSRLVQLDLELLDGLEFASEGLEYRAEGSARERGGDLTLDELHARVLTTDGQGLVVEAFADAARREPAGVLEVELPPDALYLDEAGARIEDPESFGMLTVPGVTLVELRAERIGPGLLRAHAVEVEQLGGATAAVETLEFEGRLRDVEELPGGRRLSVDLAEIERGAEALAELNGSDLQFEFEVDAQTRLYRTSPELAGGHEPVEPAALSRGQWVHVEVPLASLDAPRAERLVLDDPTVVQPARLIEIPAGGAPWRVRLEPTAPALRSGEVLSPETVIEVPAPSFLVGPLELDQLPLDDWLLDLVGPISGTPEAPVLTPLGATIGMGRLRGELVGFSSAFEPLVAVSALGPLLQPSIGTGIVVLFPFPLTAPGPGEPGELVVPFLELQQDERLQVEAEGIPTTNPNLLLELEVDFSTVKSAPEQAAE